VNFVAEGLAGVAESLVPPGMMDLPKVAYPYDPAKAKQLLAEAGYPQGIKLKLWAPQGRYLKDKEIGEAVQAQLKQVASTPTCKSGSGGPTTRPSSTTTSSCGSRAGLYRRRPGWIRQSFRQHGRL